MIVTILNMFALFLWSAKDEWFYNFEEIKKG